MRTQARRDFVAVVGESLANECLENRQMVRMVDVTIESKPFGVSTWTVPEASGRLLRPRRPLRHALVEREHHADLLQAACCSSRISTPACARVDVRDPFNPKEIGYYIPAITDKTDKRCVGTGADERCKVAIQTNNVEVDDRGYIYIADRANTGLHILELAGPARKVANFP